MVLSGVDVPIHHAPGWFKSVSPTPLARTLPSAVANSFITRLLSCVLLQYIEIVTPAWRSLPGGTVGESKFHQEGISQALTVPPVSKEKYRRRVTGVISS